MSGILDGIRVIDFTRFVAGPWCTSLLGDLGADVVKIEQPEGGDGSRHFNDLFGSGESSYHAGLNRNKRSVTLDVREKAGKNLARELIADADVLVTNFRPGVMERLGLGFNDLNDENPRLIYCAITAYGEEGPYVDRPGMDGILQAMGGIMGLTGEYGRDPVRIGVPIADYTGAFLAISSIAFALYKREQTGHGRRVSVSLLDGQVAMLANLIPGFAVTGQPDGPIGTAHQQIEPSRSFRTADGHIVVSALTQLFWEKFANAIGLGQLVADERFKDNKARVANRDALLGLVQPVLQERPTAEWVQLLQAQDVPCAPVNRLDDIITDPQVAENEMIRNVELSNGAVATLVGNPLKLNADAGPPRPPPVLGQHTDEVLMNRCGLSEAELEQLREQGVIGGHANQTA